MLSLVASSFVIFTQPQRSKDRMESLQEDENISHGARLFSTKRKIVRRTIMKRDKFKDTKNPEKNPKLIIIQEEKINSRGKGYHELRKISGEDKRAIFESFLHPSSCDHWRA